jgi:hypothetical protein
MKEPIWDSAGINKKRKKRRKTTQAAKHTCINKGRGDTLAQSAVSLTHQRKKKTMGIWRVAGSPLLQTETLRAMSGRGKLRETGSIPAAPPATSRATNPRQHRPKNLNKPGRDIHLVEIKYCEDTRPQNQLNAAKKQHKDLCNIL